MEHTMILRLSTKMDLICIFLCTACAWLFWTLAFEATLQMDFGGKKEEKAHQINKRNPTLGQSN